jgi:dienelactone hydrolase
MPRRLAAYRFFSRWLEGNEDTSPEPAIRVLTERELWCTRTGQVATEFPGGASVFTLNQKRFEQVRQSGATVDSVRALVGYAPRTGPPRIRRYGSTARLEKLTFESEPGIDLPAVIYLPQGEGKHRAAVIAHGRGKSAAREMAEKMAAAGKLVLSIDLRGLGELQAAQRRSGSDWPGYFGDYESAMTAMMTGKPLVAMRAEDIARAVDVLLARADVDAAGLELYGHGVAAVPALYAAAFDKRIAAVTLERMLHSYESIIRQRIHRQQWENAVQGALRHYDLPDLVRWIAPRKVTMIDPVNPLGL